MPRNDLSFMILCPGELHVVMAQLRTLGSFIENCGIDLCWSESELYGPKTVKQILDGNHAKRGEEAHMITLQVLFTLYTRELFNLTRSTEGGATRGMRKAAGKCL